MSSLLKKISDLKDSGEFPEFDPTNHIHVLDKARVRGLKTQILFEAMDIIRDNSEMSNSAAILKAAKRWNLI